jgi:hypothetical protein
VQQQRVQQAKESALARDEAREIQRTHSAIFQQLPVPVTDLAQALGLKVERRPELRQRARLEFVVDAKAELGTIVVQANLDHNVSRFAVAHEIGHAVLLRKHPDAAREWETSRREAFANIFATELLASPGVRAEMATTFRSLCDPVALLRLASQMGLSPHALLRLAMFERPWIKGLNKIWLRVKYIENAFTHRDAKLRIVSAHYDPDRFFIAPNQSLVRFAGDDSWLSSLLTGSVAHHSTTINVSLKRPAPAAPKFVSKQMPATLSAVRLRPSTADQAAYLIILADLTAIGAET